MNTQTQTAAAHTPGPWTINGCSHQYEGAVSGAASLIESADIGAVCLMIDTDDQRVEAANALLIAAAPDLLAALRGVLAWCIENEERPTYATKLQKGPTFAAARDALKRAGVTV